MHSPIKYFGGKTNMTDRILSLFPDKYGTYVEGFGGGASLLFAKNPTPVEIYNDLGKNVYSLFKVLSDPVLYKELKERLDITPYSRELRAEFKLKLREPLSLVTRAYYFFYVNRTSFNGVGGFSITSVIRRNMSKSVSDYLSAVDGLDKFHNRLSKVIIEQLDIMDLLEKHNREDTLIYLGPPYVHSTRASTTAYEVEMSDTQHEEMLSYLVTHKAKILISGYDNTIYTRLSSWNRTDFKSPNVGSNSTETIWTNY